MSYSGQVAVVQPRQGQQQADEHIIPWDLPKRVQAIAYLRVFQLADVAVYVQDEVVEVVGYLVHAEVIVEPGPLDNLPDLLAQHRQLLRVHSLSAGVLVHQLLAAGDVAVAVGSRHGGHEMVDDDGVTAALGLSALARVVDDERVKVGQVRQAHLGQTRARKPNSLARRPLQRAMLAEMRDGVGSESVPQPAVECHVVMRGHKIGTVVDGDGVLAESARRLYANEHVTQSQTRHEQVAVVDVRAARRLAPVSLDGVLHLHRNACELRRVLGCAHAPLGVSHLLRGQEVRVIGAALYELSHQRITVGGDVLDLVASVTHLAEKVDGGRGRIQAHGVSKSRRLRRIVAEDDCDPALGHGDSPQLRVPSCEGGHGLGALDVRGVSAQLAGFSSVLRFSLLE